jgi:hypothetical protein
LVFNHLYQSSLFSRILTGMSQHTGFPRRWTDDVTTWVFATMGMRSDMMTGNIKIDWQFRWVMDRTYASVYKLTLISILDALQLPTAFDLLWYFRRIPPIESLAPERYRSYPANATRLPLSSSHPSSAVMSFQFSRETQSSPN